MATQKENQYISLEEISKHSSCDSCWITINNNVYDVTSFLDEHPAGSEVILEYAGGDATQAFEEVGHSVDAYAMLSTYKIGILLEPHLSVTKDEPQLNFIKDEPSLNDIKDDPSSNFIKKEQVKNDPNPCINPCICNYWVSIILVAVISAFWFAYK